MINNILRTGNFTSSDIVALTTPGTRDMTPAELANRPKTGKGSAAKTIQDTSVVSQTALTYIAEKNMERRLGISLDTEVTAKPTTWGLLCEPFIHSLLDTSYQWTSTETHAHPDYDFWVGSRDGLKHDEGLTVLDGKAPFTRKSFCMLVDPLYDGLEGMDAMNAIRFGYTDKNGVKHDKHKEGETYYQQLVSNATIAKAKFAELIVFMPYFSQIDEIRNLANGNDGAMWVAFAKVDELPFLPDGGFYKNINIIRFEVPQEDKEFLTECIVTSSKLLTPR